MLYEFVSLEDFLEQLKAFGIIDLWVTTRLQLQNYDHHPFRQHYTAEGILSTRVPQGVALYRRSIGGDFGRGLVATDLAREVSNPKMLMSYFENPRLDDFEVRNGIWVAPAHYRTITVDPGVKGGERHEAVPAVTPSLH